MKRLSLIICTSLFLTACGLTGTNSASKSAKLKVGDSVLFKLSRDGFGEGKIETIDGSHYKIPYGSSTNTVDEIDVYPTPTAGTDPNVKVGDYVIAKHGNDNFWPAAEVTKVDAKVIEVKALSSGSSMSLSPEQVVAVRPATAEEFKKVKEEAAFEAKVSPMRPTVPEGYTPKKDDRVVARWSGTSWYSGTILSVNGEKAKIKWSVNFGDGDVDLTKIAPYPKLGSTGLAIKAGDIVLVKGSSETSGWDFAEATSTREVKFKDGKTRSVRGDEYILFN